MTDHSRPTLHPLLVAVQTVLENIDFDGDTYQAGIGEAPPCNPPYLIISTPSIGSVTTGPMGAPEVDGEQRVQVTAIAEQALASAAMRDKASAALTTPALDAALTDRRVMSIRLDISRGPTSSFGSRPEPLFSTIDQYEIMTTPG